MLTIRYGKLTISLQKHGSQGTTVLIACERRRISTSGLEQNATKRAQLRHAGQFQPTVTPQLQFTLTFLPYTVKSPGRTSRLDYIRCHISTSGNAQFDAELAQIESCLLYTSDAADE